MNDNDFPKLGKEPRERERPRKWQRIYELKIGERFFLRDEIYAKGALPFFMHLVDGGGSSAFDLPTYGLGGTELVNPFRRVRTTKFRYGISTE